MNILSWFSGYRTYALGLVAVIYGLVGYFTGWATPELSAQSVWFGLTTLGMRSAIGKAIDSNN